MKLKVLISLGLEIIQILRYLNSGIILSGDSNLSLLQVWDLIKLADYLTKREDIDPARIGITGESLGGWSIEIEEAHIFVHILFCITKFVSLKCRNACVVCCIC